MNFKEIAEGWKNKMIPASQMKQKIEDVYNFRMEVCKQCEFFSGNRIKNGYKTLRIDDHCTNCGCPLMSKNRCLSCECPLKKWTSVTTDEEYEAIKNFINENT